MTDQPNEIEAVAERIYRDTTANHPTIHCNRFSPWGELSEATREDYRGYARAAIAALTQVAPATVEEATHVREVNEAHRNGWREAMVVARQSAPLELVERLLHLKRMSASIYGPLIDQVCAALADISPEPRAVGGVEQVDREAAADFYRHNHNVGANIRVRIREGERDNDPMVQAFTRHRTGAEAKAISMLREAEEALHGCLEHMKWSTSQGGQAYVNAQSCHAKLAALRSLPEPTPETAG